MHGVGVGIDQHITGNQAELRHEALDALTGVADENPAGDLLGRSRIRTDAKKFRGTVETATIENRFPVIPIDLAVLFIAREIGEVSGEGSGWSGIERGRGDHLSL